MKKILSILEKIDAGLISVFNSDDYKQPHSWGDLAEGQQVLVSLGAVSYYRKFDWVQATIVEVLPDPAVLYALQTGWLGVAPKLEDMRRIPDETAQSAIQRRLASV